MFAFKPRLTNLCNFNMATLQQSVDSFQPRRLAAAERAVARSEAHVGQNPLLQAQQSKILARSDVLLWVLLSATALGLIGLTLWFVFGVFVPTELDPHQTFNTVEVTQALTVGDGNYFNFLAFGSTAVDVGTGTLPTVTAVNFRRPAPKRPVVTLTPEQAGQFYTGLSFSVSNVTTSGFNIIVDAVRTGSSDGATSPDVTLARVPQMTEPLNVSWLALA